MEIKDFEDSDESLSAMHQANWDWYSLFFTVRDKLSYDQIHSFFYKNKFW